LTTQVQSRLPSRCLASRQIAPALDPVCGSLNRTYDRVDDAQASGVTRKAPDIRRGCDDVQPGREDRIDPARTYFSALATRGRAIASAPGHFSDRESPATGVAQGTVSRVNVRRRLLKPRQLGGQWAPRS
jgi:hypothetical protein